jgi:rubrerythrin
MHTSQQWWNEIKLDGDELAHWLRRQYIGEMAAVNLLSEVLLRFGAEATPNEWANVHKVMVQEAIHAKWMFELADRQGVVLEHNASAERKYWAEVLPNVHNFRDAMAAGFHAESMRLERIRVIAHETDPKYKDFADTFARILPHEEWHEHVFNEMRQGRELTPYHEKGLEALNLLMT